MGDGGFGGGGFDQANTNAPLPGVDSMGGGGAGRHPPGGTGASGKGGDGVVIIKYLA